MMTTPSTQIDSESGGTAPKKGATPTMTGRQTGNPMWVWAFLITTIALAGIGFIFKFVEFVVSWAKSDGVDFALVPIATYLAVAAGYMCLFVWAWRRGMFKDIEAPKYRMLEMQDDFDAKERRP